MSQYANVPMESMSHLESFIGILAHYKLAY